MNKWRKLWTDELPGAWRDTIDAATSFGDLRKRIERDYRWLVPDALAVVKAASEDEWEPFRAGLDKERRREFAGAAWGERWMVLLLPDVLIALFERVPKHSSMPVHVAVDRLVELGFLASSGNSYVLPKPSESVGGSKP